MKEKGVVVFKEDPAHVYWIGVGLIMSAPNYQELGPGVWSTRSVIGDIEVSESPMPSWSSLVGCLHVSRTEFKEMEAPLTSKGLHITKTLNTIEASPYPSPRSVFVSPAQIELISSYHDLPVFVGRPGVVVCNGPWERNLADAVVLKATTQFIFAFAN